MAGPPPDTNPDRSSPDAPAPVEGDGVDRRAVLRGAALAGGLATVGTFWLEGFGDPARRLDVTPTRPGAPPQAFTEPGEFALLEAALARVLPGSGPEDPGAHEVLAAGYLDAVAAKGILDAEGLRLVRYGLGWLDRRTGGAGSFVGAGEARQDAALTALTDLEWGLDWIGRVLSFVLEAFFGDPVHGVNPGEVAWKWARHVPGAPRPTEAHWTLEGR